MRCESDESKWESERWSMWATGETYMVTVSP